MTELVRGDDWTPLDVVKGNITKYSQPYGGTPGVSTALTPVEIYTSWSQDILQYPTPDAFSKVRFVGQCGGVGVG